ncbi:YdcF family protein [Halioxenophilus sp. WMMB6]|uniref:YdcF family protein n=1 Tax=Halioxenophilus sp. WMMB6 TaxID=3073815 RepID=UPI00295E9125|nr:YdcF family protein [Halioxenophilus sp. WMMB6]
MPSESPGASPESEIAAAELILWQFLNGYLQSEQAAGSLAIGFGCSDLRVAAASAELYHQGHVGQILFTGGYGRLTRFVFQRPEADIFADLAQAEGVLADDIIRETAAGNTAENVLFAMALLTDAHLAEPLVLVCSNIYRPRVAATFLKHHPVQPFHLVSPAVDYSGYATDAGAREQARAMMVGEIDRLLVYPARGWQELVAIPEAVVEAYQVLHQAGYRRYLVA